MASISNKYDALLNEGGNDGESILEHYKSII